MSDSALTSKYNLPDKILVTIHRSKKGFTAVLPEYPGCITYAENMSELVENVNDALLTYLDVPRKEALKADFLYSPKTEVKKPIKRVLLKEAVSKFIFTVPQFSYA